MSNYACADIHGSLSLWNKIKNTLKPEDTLYFLGDAADRGCDGWQIIKEMLDDPRVIYIRGNHEQLLIDAVTFAREDLDLWFANGGRWTYLMMQEDDEAPEYIERLMQLPLFDIYKSNNHTFYLCHAGCTPPFYKDLLWDRSHFWDKSDTIQSNYIVVHGHTPTDILKHDFDFTDDCRNAMKYAMHFDAMVYCDGHKIDIDCGSAYTHRTVLLDLDDLTFIPFKEDK